MDKKSFYAFKAMLCGLVLAQILFSTSVYLSNIEHFRMIEVVAEAGYLTVPNAHVMPSLKTFRAMFFGGMFFTLTVGASLSILALAGAWLWNRMLDRNPYFLIPLAIPWLWGILSVTGIIHTACFVLIPAGVFGTAWRWMPRQIEPSHSRQPWIRLVPLIALIPFTALCIAGYSAMNGEMFLNIRDHLLLSNSLGIKVNDFYYKYTLYAARVFKSPKQRLIRTCSLSWEDGDGETGEMPSRSMVRRVERVLLNHDYLLIPKEQAMDLDMIISARAQDLTSHKGTEAQKEDAKVSMERGRTIDFMTGNTRILQTPVEEFLRHPRKVLNTFSEKSDRHGFLRQITFHSLLFVLLIMLYASLYVPFRILLGLFVSDTQASVGAGILTCMAGVFLLVTLSMMSEKHIENKDLAQILASDNWRRRVSALKLIRKKKQDIADFPTHTRLLRSPHIPERYWLAKALGESRSPATRQELLTLLDDPNFNVAYSALSGLSRRGGKGIVEEILKRLKTSHNWYVQWYAYKALRRLGWKNRSQAGRNRAVGLWELQGWFIRRDGLFFL